MCIIADADRFIRHVQDAEDVSPMGGTGLQEAR